MNRLITLCAACALAAPAYAQTMPAAPAAQQGGPEELFDRFAQALANADIQAMMDMHSDDAILVPSNGGPFVRGKAAIESYYKSIFAATRSRQAIKPPGSNQWQVFGDTAIRTSNGVFEVMTDKGRQQLPLRNTYIFHKEGSDWKLVNTHVSSRTAQAASSSSAASASK